MQNNYSNVFKTIFHDIYSDCEGIALILKNEFQAGESNQLHCRFFESYIVTNKRLESGSLLYKKAYGRNGVYIFKAVKECEIPNSISINKKSRLKIYKRQINKDEIVYVGKSDSISIISRITQHYKGESSKLFLNENSDFKESLILIAFLLKKEFKDYKSLILNVAESILQNKGVVLGYNNNFTFGGI